jgi:hypothetical protein
MSCEVKVCARVRGCQAAEHRRLAEEAERQRRLAAEGMRGGLGLAGGAGTPPSRKQRGRQGREREQALRRALRDAEESAAARRRAAEAMMLSTAWMDFGSSRGEGGGALSGCGVPTPPPAVLCSLSLSLSLCSLWPLLFALSLRCLSVPLSSCHIIATLLRRRG